MDKVLNISPKEEENWQGFFEEYKFFNSVFIFHRVSGRKKVVETLWNTFYLFISKHKWFLAIFLPPSPSPFSSFFSARNSSQNWYQFKATLETKNGTKFFFVDNMEISFLARREWESQWKEYNFNCFIKLFHHY